MDLTYPKPKRDYNALTATFDRAFDGEMARCRVRTLWGQPEGELGRGRRAFGERPAGDQHHGRLRPPGLPSNGSTATCPTIVATPSRRWHGSYQVNDWLTLGGNGPVQSPRKYSCIGIAPKDVDLTAYGYQGYGFYRQGKVVDRGSAFEGDWLTQFNASAVVTIPTPGDRLDASLRLDVFNLFNSHAVTAYHEFGDVRRQRRGGHQLPQAGRVPDPALRADPAARRLLATARPRPVPPHPPPAGGALHAPERKR
ncbi:hypothetical protein ACRAWD_21470 [Caulobacter segnis]